MVFKQAIISVKSGSVHPTRAAHLRVWCSCELMSSYAHGASAEPDCNMTWWNRPYKNRKIIFRLKLVRSQCPRTHLNKRFLPRPKTTTAWKLIPHRSKISKNWNPPRWVHLYRFFKNWFLLVHKQLHSNYIQTHFT